MTQEQLQSLILILAGAVIGVASYFWRRSAATKIAAIPNPSKKIRRKKLLPTILLVACGWLCAVQLITLIFGAHPAEEFSVSLFAERMNLFGLEISSTVVLTWIAMGVLIFLALLARIFVIPKMKEKPQGVQNLLEIAVDGISNYTNSRAGGLGQNLSAYLFSIAALMVACAAVEFFGFRAPTADITMTFSMALITFILINYYGIKRKGVGGRIKSLADPTPVVLPIRMISDIAVPVSMACRLFGNMLGGMIVMDLLYSALGNAGIFFPSVVGLYFNVFHPLIQAFIFVTLTLTFINEAAE